MHSHHEHRQHREMGTKCLRERPVVSATGLGRSCRQTCAASVSRRKLSSDGKSQTSQPQRLHKRRTGKERAGRSSGAGKGGKDTVLGSVKSNGTNLLWGFLPLQWRVLRRNWSGARSCAGHCSRASSEWRGTGRKAEGALVGQRGKGGLDGRWGPGKALKAKTSRPCQKTVFGRETVKQQRGARGTGQWPTMGLGKPPVQPPPRRCPCGKPPPGGPTECWRWPRCGGLEQELWLYGCLGKAGSWDASQGVCR